MSVFSKEKLNVYDSAAVGNPAMEELGEVWNYRNLIYQLTRRDVLTRYKRSVLGIAWTMLNPLGTMLVMTIVFSSIFRFETKYSYAAYVLSGLMVWNYFQQTTTASIVNLVWGGGLLHRIYVPRTSFAISAILTGVVNVLFSMVPLFAVMLITGSPIRWTFLLFPIPLFLLACFALGVGLTISAFAVYFPDVSEMYQIIVLAWMYLTPIIYPEEILPIQYRYLVTRINPMFYLTRLFREVILFGQMPGWKDVLPAVVVAFGALAIGWFFFTHKSGEFAYRI